MTEDRKWEEELKLVEENFPGALTAWSDIDWVNYIKKLRAKDKERLLEGVAGIIEEITEGQALSDKNGLLLYQKIADKINKIYE